MTPPVLWRDTVESTSLEAGRHDPPLWVAARMQTGARGRRGRAWAMAPGDFAASLAYRPPGGPADHALRSFVASLALHDALAGLGVTGLALKWPNDVLQDGGKLAGILLEAPRPGLLVVGIGVNLAGRPPHGALEVGALPPASLDGAVTPDALMAALAPRYAAWEDRFARDGFAPVRDAWLARAARLGERITARTATRTTHGTFETIDAAGHLVLATGTGPATIPAADVFFEPAEAPPCS